MLLRAWVTDFCPSKNFFVPVHTEIRIEMEFPQHVRTESETLDQSEKGTGNSAPRYQKEPFLSNRTSNHSSRF